MPLAAYLNDLESVHSLGEISVVLQSSRGWQWALGELLIVIVGVLVALAVDSWSQSTAAFVVEGKVLK